MLYVMLYVIYCYVVWYRLYITMKMVYGRKKRGREGEGGMVEGKGEEKIRYGRNVYINVHIHIFSNMKEERKID